MTAGLKLPPPRLASLAHRASLMNTEELTAPATSRARTESAMYDASLDKVVHRPMPPLERTRFVRLETSAEIAQALHIDAMPSNRTSRRVVVAISALVLTCLVMAAIVWWRLLTG